MTRSTLVALTMVAVVACGKGDRKDAATADSLGRDLQLAPTDTTRPLADSAVATTPPAEATPAPVTPAPKTTTPKPRPTTPAPVATARSLDAGTIIEATARDTISSRKNKVGEKLYATVSSDVKDARGRTVIPAGSTITFNIQAIHESENKSDNTGTLTLMPQDISVNGQTYTLNASIESVESQLVGRGTNAGDVAKVGVGAGAGAIVGRVIGGNKKGAVIGGIVGAAVGTQRAVETKDRDIVVPAGAKVVVKLTQGFQA